MNHHNLDDLIIDNIDPKDSKIKNILTIIALIIVILIIAIILTKIILKDPNTQRIALEENNTELISPELTLQHAAQSEESKKETMPPAPAQETPVKESMALADEEISAPKKESAASTESQPIENTQKSKIVSKIVGPDEGISEYAAAETIKEESKPVSAQETAAPETTAMETTVPKTVAQETAASEPSKRIEKTVEQPIQAEAAKPSLQQTESSQYYIQVGSFRSMPSAQFLNVIKNSGFEYHIVPEASSDTKKLLIGPYRTRSEADSAIMRVKDRINKSAFVIKK